MREDSLPVMLNGASKILNRGDDQARVAMLHNPDLLAKK